ncbi:hypothetical protein OC844_005858 [Tilletia horrida]|nr:hypothetical protein OC844_005858 [Tilletia horrida]
MSSLDAQERGEPGARRPPPLPTPGGPKPQQPPRLTQKEYEALRRVESSVKIWRTGGLLFGTALATFYARRRQPPMKALPTVGVAIIGGWVGGFMAMPIGVITSRSSLKDVEDPNHLKQVLAEAVAQKRMPGAPSPLSRPPSAGPAGAPGQPGAESGFAPEYPSAPASFPSTSAPGPSFAPEDGQSSSSAAAAPAQGSSRWAQIRGDRSSPSSSWDRIRSQNPASSAPQSSSGPDSGAGPSPYDPYPSLNGPQERSWPTSPNNFSGGSPYPASSGSGDGYPREQSEFDAMLDRERRMAEDNQGAERLGTGFVGEPQQRRSRWA